MPNRTYAEMEKAIRDHFAKISKEDFELALKKASFDYFNQVSTPILLPQATWSAQPDMRHTLFSGVCRVVVQASTSMKYDAPVKFGRRWRGQPKNPHYKLAA